MVETINVLLDPCKDRVVKTVPLPPRYPMKKDELYQMKGKSNLKALGKVRVPNAALMRKHLLKEGTVSKDLLVTLLQDVTTVFRAEPNLIKLREPCVIIGDIHSQFYDMIHMFEKVIDPRMETGLGGNNNVRTNLLFLGDYVDRGIFSLEVCLYLFCLKINNPNEVIMLRGNHESRAMTEHFTFRSEIL
jgi:serine/threonine-protein phosphatase 2B catalytic subunit